MKYKNKFLIGLTPHLSQKSKVKSVSFLRKKGVGFTLVEFMIVAALIIMFSSLTLPVGFNFYQESTLRDQTRSLENSLRKTQAMAITGRGDSNAGVKITQKELTIFEGESYEKRRQETDIVISFPIALSASGADEIVFQKLTGLPVLTEGEKLTTVTLSFGTNSQEITVNSQGKIERHELKKQK